MQEMFDLTRKALALVDARGKKIFLAYLISLVLVASLDGLALVLIARLLDSSSNTSEVTRDTSITVVAIVLLFFSRSLLSVIATWISVKELASQEVEIGQARLSSIHNSSLESRLGLNESDYFTSIDRAPNYLVQGFLVSVITICAEALSGVVILAVVLFLQPTTAVIALVYFLSIAWAQHGFLSKAQKISGESIHIYGNSTYELLSDYFNLDKLLHVHASNSFFSQLEIQRSHLSMARAKLSFISAIPRYFMEAMLALGFLVIAGATWLLSGQESVVPAIAIFAAAGYRLLPIVNRIQGLTLSAIGYSPLAKEALKPFEPRAAAIQSRSDADGSENILELQGVSYSYPSDPNQVLHNVNYKFKSGLIYAIVGPSGSGKTTLVDICLGLLAPTEGTVMWNVAKGDLVLGYVPQDTYISSTGLGGNVALEWDNEEVDFEQVVESLKKSMFVSKDSETNGLDFDKSQMEKMSGGQRQRLGLARALYRNSSFLILDEATSSLDAVTESQVMDTVRALRGRSTVVIVAHRLTTIKDADQVIYLDRGEILGSGTFVELQRKLPQFAEQVKLGQLDIIE
jgi:ABC-type multidrug transport system fused ATPase/permease subunit